MDWILDFWDQDSRCLQQDQGELFLAVVEAGLDLHFVVPEKNVTGCWLELYLFGVKHGLDCLCHVDTGSRADSKFRIGSGFKICKTGL